MSGSGVGWVGLGVVGWRLGLYDIPMLRRYITDNERYKYGTFSRTSLPRYASVWQ